ncbi:SIR2 family protein [Buttiauxella sp. A2-C1_F]|uniref:SIR2 family protein n=1 Tax=Buttiauxella sp. A2-C1_F TaxID=2904526 RepID=UPI001E4A0A40|nr:SIR2 family protein [Buttiauxella sp. A2-C1_F]MCE0844492.1 SIR2 family protein [Buttiauxella sp. A2-C1_F]
MKDQLTEILKSRPAGPFLFIGSGLSRRYIGLEDWQGLLSKFCVTGKPFEYYLASANGDYPQVASLLATEFNEYWWGADEYKNSVASNKSKITDSTSALRIEICKYLSTLDPAKAKQSDYIDEINLLAELNVDGIITTNWDMFLEQLFPDYKIYIGQEELLFSNPQQIGEIYKIHGCSTIPSSLVLTNNDYKEFNERNAYLASKLITIFVEHPIIFIGYSISDPNISSLLCAISNCIGKNNIEQLRKNLIFVERPRENEPEGISDTYITINGIQIPLILVRTNDFKPIYQALGATKRKIPARVLRYCKEQMYELVKSSEPEKKLCVVNLDDIDRKEDIEFLVGVGVASDGNAGIADIGYAPIELHNLINDILHDNCDYNAQAIIDNVIRVVGRRTKNIPIFKYLRAIGITSLNDYNESGLELDKWVKRDIKDFRVNSYSKPFFRNYRHKNMQEIINSCTAENAASFIPFLPADKINLEVLKEFLIIHEAKMDYNISSYASGFRKLAVLFDKLKHGF